MKADYRPQTFLYRGCAASELDPRVIFKIINDLSFCCPRKSRMMKLTKMLVEPENKQITATTTTIETLKQLTMSQSDTFLKHSSQSLSLLPRSGLLPWKHGPKLRSLIKVQILLT